MDDKIGVMNVYTDLAIDSREMASKEDIEIEGVRLDVEGDENIRVTIVDIQNENGKRLMKRPIGKYITIESESMKINDVDTHEDIIKIMAQKIGELTELKPTSAVLVVGLGNWSVTPDSLGPKVISKILVTRHLSDTGALPDALEGSLRSVCAISPGVMGQTGIETLEIVKGIVDKVKPDLVVAVDALAARQTNRINSTIQMSNTGVSPGAGMCNKRLQINEETLGTPVVAVGVPTVVDAATLVNDTLDRMLDEIISQTTVGSEFYDMLKHLESEDKYRIIEQILNPYAGNMFVTPKEVDATIDRLSGIIANALNIALHPGISLSDINRYIG
ncbi:MAG: GPR endopeptidase [Clostridiales bacterium]|jgi:spore protease|nr:GPR endopeptidase [Clostridiales bacterium]